ncbi:MAG: hypothetical protein ACRELF_01800, partial [Gemmataceae bacterium]
MRLTLRTLLAYLDDTLEPLEIKTIGQKVAESETAQELIARIKQVTRRRRITTPPATGPNSFDANLVAEYLDSELSTEQLAELEKICLESDVHLAEVASCHQILTVVLGEPAHVPPTAKERMYALVQGREAIPFRKAATANSNASAPTSADADADEMFLLGLPFYRRGSWLRWALPLAAVLLFTVVGVTLWQTIHGVDQPTPNPRLAQAEKGNPQPADNSNKAEIKKPENDPKKDNIPPPVDPSKTPGKTLVKPPENNPAKDPKNTGSQAELKTPANTAPPANPDQRPVESPAVRAAPAKTDRVEVGRYHTDIVGPPSLLVQFNREKDKFWNLVKPGARVSTNVQLMSLPGYASVIRLDNGLHLLLRGHVPEFTPQLLIKDARGELKNEAAPMDYLQECAIVLNKPNHTDADVTLRRGRLYLSNHSTKQPGTIVVRLRFEKKVWDLTLHPGAEVVLDLAKHQQSGEPVAELYCFLLSGTAGLALEGDNYPILSVPGWAFFVWNSTRPNSYLPNQIRREQLDHATRVLFAKRPTVNSADAGGMERALTTVKKMMALGESPLLALREVLGKPGRENPYEHRLAIYCLGAMDEIEELMKNILDKADLLNPPDRRYAIVALRRWLDRGPEQSNKLFDLKTGKGLLTKFEYTRDEAERIMVLLRDPTYEQVFNSKTYYEEAAKDLASEKVAIAELAHWWLSRLAISMFHLNMPRLKTFNAAVPR